MNDEVAYPRDNPILFYELFLDTKVDHWGKRRVVHTLMYRIRQADIQSSSTSKDTRFRNDSLILILNIVFFNYEDVLANFYEMICHPYVSQAGENDMVSISILHSNFHQSDSEVMQINPMFVVKPSKHEINY